MNLGIHSRHARAAWQACTSDGILMPLARGVRRCFWGCGGVQTLFLGLKLGIWEPFRTLSPASMSWCWWDKPPVPPPRVPPMVALGQGGLSRSVCSPDLADLGTLSDAPDRGGSFELFKSENGGL